MINGQAVKGAKRLANHLTKDENEKVSILEISGTAVNDNLHFALRDMEDVGKLTKSQTGKVLYHANINPRKNETLSREQYIQACDTLMEKLGFDGQPRAIVMHQKEGRQHAHLVVQLTDLEKGKLKSTSNNYYKHKEVAKELEKTFQLKKSPRRYTGRSYSQSEAQQSKKIGEKTNEVRAMIRSCYQHSKSGEEFVSKLFQKGFYVTKGKRLTVVDKKGNVQSLTRQLKKIATAKEVKKKLEPIIRHLPETDKIQKDIRSLNSAKQLENSAQKLNQQRKYQRNKYHINSVQDKLNDRLEFYKSIHEKDKIEKERER